MSRNFPDFFKAYQEYANIGGFIPPQFNEWGCLSILAAALERKVWLPWNETFTVYPNIYVLFVAGSGEGKSAALNKAVGLLQEANLRTSTINVLPNQATEAAFLIQVSKGRTFTYGTQVLQQNAAFYRASEASACLRNIYNGGTDFIATLTDLYDCPDIWQKAIVKDGDMPRTLKNVCINLLAGCTFNYLGELVSDKNISGGFASRAAYIVSWDKEVKPQQFQDGASDAEKVEILRYRKALIEDFLAIHRMFGPMQAEPEFGKAWETWWYDFEINRRKLPSEKLKSLLVRTNERMLKIAMLLSVAESDARILKLSHWEKAHDLVMRFTEGVSDVFRESRASATDKSLRNIAPAILHALKKNPRITHAQMIAELHISGFKASDVESILGNMLRSGKLEVSLAIAGGGSTFKVVGNPDDYF